MNVRSIRETQPQGHSSEPGADHHDFDSHQGEFAVNNVIVISESEWSARAALARLAEQEERVRLVRKLSAANRPAVPPAVSAVKR